MQRYMPIAILHGPSQSQRIEKEGETNVALRTKALRGGSVLARVALVVCFFLLIPATWADSVTLLAETGENSTFTCTSSATPTASCAGGLSASATGSLVTGTVGATAGGTGPLPNLPGQTNWVASSQADISYTYTVTGVTNGTIVTTVSSTGTTSSSASGLAEAAISIPTTESFQGLGSATSFLLPNGASTVQIVTPVSAGIATFSFDLGAFAQCPPASPLTGLSCSATADYLDPVTITSVAVYDANGNLVQNATLTSQSGFSPTVAMPEPSSFLLLGTSLLVLVGLTLKKTAALNNARR